MSSRKIAAMLAAAAVVPASLPTLATDWDVQPRLELGYQFDDNYRLDVEGNEIEVSGAMIDGSLGLDASTQLTRFNITPRVRSTYFPDERSEESDDYFLSMTMNHDRQRLRSGFRFNYDDKTVVLSELPVTGPEPDLGEPNLGGADGADAGRISIRNRRQSFEFQPSLDYDFSSRRSLGLGAYYRDIGFDRTVVGEQEGYRQFGASAGMTFAQSQRTSVTLRGVVDRYEPDEVSTEALGYGLQAEWSTQTSQTRRTYLRLGAQQTDIDRGSSSRSETSYIAGAGTDWQGQTGAAFFDATRSVGPTASGFLVARNQLRLRFTNRLSERTGWFASLRGIHDSALEDNTTYATRKYANGNLGFEWRLNRQISLAAGYDYTWQEFEDELSDRKSQGAFASFVYQPRRRD